MIADLKPYPACKESGLSWLGQVPAHWETLPVKQAFDIQLGKTLQNVPQTVADSSVPYLKSQHVQWSGVRTSALPRMWASPRDLSQFGVRAGDLLVCEGGEGGRCAVLKSILSGVIIQNALHRVRPRGENDNRFLAQVMAVVSSVGWFEAINNKATIAHFTRDKFGSLVIPLPSPAEQAAIARFLDWANGRLERAIRAKRQVIALLNEQKQAIIASLVTGKCEVRRVKGEDGHEVSYLIPRPSHLMKPSGIPWLGDIPQHWESISLRMRYSVELGKMLDAKRITGRHAIPYLRNRDVQWDRIVVDDLPMMDIPPGEIARYTVRGGDLLVCEGGQVGRCAFWDAQIPVCGFQKALHRVRSLDSHSDHPRFFFYQMQLAAGRGVFSADGNENTIAHLTCEKLRRHRFAFPPFAEQKAVADWLDEELRQFQIAITHLDHEITLLREYRTRLVADVVTGKLDVREAAARLPDEAPPDPTEDDTNWSDDEAQLAEAED
jgi:type I restriction enzyme S subunit